MQTTVGSHELALVPPQDFSVRMRKHWSETLNMPTPSALIAVHRLMAEEFQRLIINNATDAGGSASVVLPLPTGSGKTQGTCLYASMQAEFNVHAADNKKPVGIVIITRLIDDADYIANQINELAGRSVAVAHHTKNKADTVDVFNRDVLVICQIAPKCDPLFASKNDPSDGAETGGAEPHIAEQSRSWRTASGKRDFMRGS